MAKTKVRRIIRKRKLPQAEPFEEQLWPIQLALVILGGFLIGLVLAYLRFNDLRWWANAVTWLIVTPFAVGGMMVAARFIDRRVMRRAVQFSLALCVLIHVVMGVVMHESVIFNKMFPPAREVADVVHQRVAVPDYHRFQVNPEERRRQDFLQPVETQTPEPQPQDVLQQEQVADPSPIEQAQPQPQPLPEPQQSVAPAEMEQRRPSETAPRISDQQGRLSRQNTLTAPQAIAEVVAAPTPARAASRAGAPSPTPSPVDRQTEETQAQRRPIAQEPATLNEQPQTQLSRRETQQSALSQMTAAPTLPRRVADPQIVPRTQSEPSPQVASAQTPQPQDVAPSRVSMTRQTASPALVGPAAVAPPEAAAQAAPQPQRRQVDLPAAPTIAQAPAPNPQQRTATQSRPETAIAAANPTASAAPQPALAATAVTPQTSPIPRQSPEPFVPRAAPAEAPAAVTAQQVAPAPAARREAQATVAAGNQPAQPMRRQATQEIAAANTQAQPGALAGGEAAVAEAPQPNSTAIARQATASPGVARGAANLALGGVPTTDASGVSRSATRRLPAESAPTIAQTPSPTAGQRRPVQSMPTVSETAAAATPGSAPAVSSTAAGVRPTTSTVARQATSGPTVSQNALALEAPSPGPSLTAVGPSATRAQTAAVPSANPEAAPTARPQRSASLAAVAASPTPVESPALAVASQQAGAGSPQPGQMALSRGETGIAGIGASVNLDRAGPTSAGASTAASGSANRATARSAESGPELSPSAPALIARANAGDPAPSATLQAVDAAMPNVLGAAHPGEINASASAALVRANGQGEAGPISAAAGTVEVDIGPTRIVPTEGFSRGAGGGQPELNPQQQSRLTARGAASGAPQIALATPTIAEIPSAPAGTGGGEAPRATPQMDATAAIAANPGGASPISGGPSSAMEVGPASESSGATTAGAVQVARAETLEAPPGAAQPGGGAGEASAEGQSAQLPRAAGGSPEGLSATAEMLAASPPSTPGSGAPGSGGSPNKDDEEDRLAALAAMAGAEGAAEVGGAAVAGGGGSLPSGPPSEPSQALMSGPAQVARAESVAAAPGAPEAGGGSLARTQPSAGPPLAAGMQAEAPAVAGAPSSGGQTGEASRASAAGELDAPLEGGVLAQAVAGPTGAMEGPEVIDAPRGSEPGPQLGRRNASSGTAEGPLLADAADTGSPGRRDSQVAVAGGLSAEAAPMLPAGAPSGAGAIPDMAAVAGNLQDMGEMDMSQLAFQAAGGSRPVSVSAPEGPGGLGDAPTADVGLANRRGQPEADVVHFREARFVRRDVGGVPSVNLTAVAPAEAFSQRLRPKNQGGSGDPAGGGGPPPLTEEAVEMGLSFLARHQMPDGSWSFANFGRGQSGYENETAALESDTAATGLALLAFQGGGYTHQNGKYRETVRKALEFLLRSQREDGDLYLRTGGPSDAAMWLYSHGVASIALCEAYGMTQDPEIKDPTQKALDFIVAGQHKTRGGWRYSPNYGSDTSVTGWMMMALKSGELAGLNVPEEAFRNVEKWLDSAQKSPTDRHLYVYNPVAPDTAEQRHGRRPNPTMTSVGLLMRLHTGWRRDNVHLVAGAEYLLSNAPAIGTRREPTRDAYYWYYATQVLYHMGGDYWKKWNDQLHPLLIKSQEKSGPMAGSWDARNPVPDRWGPHCGRLYVTTLNLLSLEVYYRHLPLYVETGK